MSLWRDHVLSRNCNIAVLDMRSSFQPKSLYDTVDRAIVAAVFAHPVVLGRYALKCASFDRPFAPEDTVLLAVPNFNQAMGRLLDADRNMCDLRMSSPVCRACMHSMFSGAGVLQVVAALTRRAGFGPLLKESLRSSCQAGSPSFPLLRACVSAAFSSPSALACIPGADVNLHEL